MGSGKKICSLFFFFFKNARIGTYKTHGDVLGMTHKSELGLLPVSCNDPFTGVCSVLFVYFGIFFYLIVRLLPFSVFFLVSIAFPTLSYKKDLVCYS